MEAGPMRHRVTIKMPPTTQDDYGEPTQTWTDFAVNVPAEKLPLLGNEFFRAETMQSKVEVKFRMRYRPGIDDTMRVQHGPELYEILSAIDVESRHRELLIYARKVVS